MLKVLVLSPGDDTGSVGINIKGAFDRHSTKYLVRAVRNTDNYARHPYDIQGWNDHRELLNRLYDEADIIHWMESFDGESFFARRRSDKPTVLHHHGSRLRDAPIVYDEGCKRNAMQICSTVDLVRWGYRSGHEIRWVPNPYDMVWLMSFKVHNHGREGTLIMHSPTNRAIKGTAMLETAFEDARRRVAYPKLIVNEYRPWVENLRLKGECDIYYDCPYGIGNNAIEAMGMGIPVIAGLVPSQWADQRVRDLMVAHWGSIPFYEHHENDLADALVALASDDLLRSRWGNIGYEYANQFHDERKVVQRLERIYEELLDNVAH